MLRLASGWGDWDRTSACGFQRPMPYRLATPQGKAYFTHFLPYGKKRSVFLMDLLPICGQEGSSPLPALHNGNGLDSP